MDEITISYVQRPMIGFVKKIVAAMLLLMLVACASTPQPTPSATPIPTRTASATPTASPLPPSEAPEASLVPSWNGIPIMSGAIAGEGDEEGYVFMIAVTASQVQDYYQLELEKLGWQLSSQSGEESSMTLSFVNTRAETLTINILSKGDQTLVLLVK